MSYNKRNKKQQQEEWVDVARISLWEKESKSGRKFLSGILELDDERKISIRIFKNTHPKSDKSPSFYGFGQVPESKVHLILGNPNGSGDDLEDDEDDFAF